MGSTKVLTNRIGKINQLKITYNYIDNGKT